MSLITVTGKINYDAVAFNKPDGSDRQLFNSLAKVDENSKMVKSQKMYITRRVISSIMAFF
jgi:hypothetical protein